MSNRWDERYGEEEYFYGTEPNQFLKQFIDGQGFKGRMLLPAEGEGRNAVYASISGWQVDAFDSSEKAKEKAIKLAKKYNTRINYNIGSIEYFQVKPEYYNAAVLIYTHMPQKIRGEFSLKLWESMHIGGKLIMEVFSLKQLDRNTFEPKDPDFLFTKEGLLKEFSCFRTELISEETIQLKEGPGHAGEADVIRFIGRK
ncbi:MAG: class I SAM-dependent methyltransferase [Bacteroidales bacterium]|nr:class I SAM-dependent methyltransferase [Bacteroidales bacterium]